MRILLDANLLVHLANPVDPQRQRSIDAISALAFNGHKTVLTPQVLYEFWVVATRPVDANGLGMTADEADADLTEFASRFEVLSEADGTFATWRELVTRYAVLGKKAHDARLVAAMLRHGVTHLLTFNEQDFARFAEITAISPEAAATLPPATE